MGPGKFSWPHLAAANLIYGFSVAVPSAGLVLDALASGTLLAELATLLLLAAGAL